MLHMKHATRVRRFLSLGSIFPSDTDSVPQYDIASLYMVRFYCFVTKACTRRPGAAASVERRRRERRTLLAGVAGELAEATWTSQAFSRMHIL